MSALPSTVDNGHDLSCVRALSIRLRSGRDRSTVVVQNVRRDDIPSVGDELRDSNGEVWYVTRIRETEVIATISFPQRADTPGQRETPETTK